MNVFIVHPHIIAGGAERQVLYLAKFLQEKKVNVSIVSLSIEGNIPRFCEKLDIRTPSNMILFRFYEKTHDRYYQQLKNVFELRKLVRKYVSNFDVVNPHNYPAPISCIGTGKKVVWMCNESPGFFGNEYASNNIVKRFPNKAALFFDRWLIKRYIDEICVIDRLNANKIANRYNRSAQIVYSGVDYEFFSQGNKYNAINKFQLDGSFVILYVGQLTAQKNQLGVVNTIDKLRMKIPNLKLVLAGRDDSQYANLVKAEVRIKRLEKNIIFTGSLTDDDIRDLYHACDVVIFPTLLQTWGLAPLEGLCANKIPIVSPLCGVAEIIKENGIGIVSHDLEDDILRVYNSPKEFSILAAKGKSFVQHHLSWDSYGQRMLSVFDKN